MAWRRARVLVLAAVVFVGGFGLPAFDVLAYHWRQPAPVTHPGVPELQPFGTPPEHAVQCALTHNAPAPRLTAAASSPICAVATAPVPVIPWPASAPAHPSRHSPDQPRAPPASIA